MKRLLIALSIAAVVGVVGVMTAWEYALEPTCESTVWSEQKSPNGTFVFSLFRRSCGATTGYATCLSIRRVGDDFDQSARDEVLLINGDVPVTASWVDVDRIEIDIPKDADIFRSTQEWEGVAITYRSN
jgi:hypothetical protein